MIPQKFRCRTMTFDKQKNIFDIPINSKTRPRRPILGYPSPLPTLFTSYNHLHTSANLTPGTEIKHPQTHHHHHHTHTPTSPTLPSSPSRALTPFLPALQEFIFPLTTFTKSEHHPACTLLEPPHDTQQHPPVDC